MIKINGVTKNYINLKKEKICVLDDVSFQIKTGEIVALLGANGSGKSSLIKCICGIVKPSKGNILVDDKDVYKHRKKLLNHIGVMFNQKPSFMDDLSVEENLRYFQSIYGIENKIYQDKLLYLDEFLSFQNLLNKPYRKLSFGERVKCELVSILLHSPKYLFLDEPTIGLDYGSKKAFYRLLENFKKQGTTILITTHEVDYLQHICDKVIILDYGRVLYNKEKKDFIEHFSFSPSLIVSYNDIYDAKKLQSLLEQKNIKQGKESSLILTYETAKQKNQILAVLMETVDIIGLEETKCDIKEILKSVIEKDK